MGLSRFETVVMTAMSKSATDAPMPWASQEAYRGVVNAANELFSLIINASRAPPTKASKRFKLTEVMFILVMIIEMNALYIVSVYLIIYG